MQLSDGSRLSPLPILTPLNTSPVMMRRRNQSKLCETRGKGTLHSVSDTVVLASLTHVTALATDRVTAFVTALVTDRVTALVTALVSQPRGRPRDPPRDRAGGSA